MDFPHSHSESDHCTENVRHLATPQTQPLPLLSQCLPCAALGLFALEDGDGESDLQMEGEERDEEASMGSSFV